MFGSPRLDISSPPTLHRQEQQAASHALPVNREWVTQNTDSDSSTRTKRLTQRMTRQLVVRRTFFLNPYHTKGKFIDYTSDRKHLIYINQEKAIIAFVSDSNGQAQELALPTVLTTDEASDVTVIHKTSNSLLIRCGKKRFPVIKQDEAWQLPFHNGTFIAYTNDHKQFIYINQDKTNFVFVSASNGQIKELELHTKITTDDLNDISVIENATSSIILIRFGKKHLPIIKYEGKTWHYPFQKPSSRPDRLLLEAVRTAEKHLKSREKNLALLMNNLALLIIEHCKKESLEISFTETLSLATKNGMHKLIRALIQKGANPNSLVFFENQIPLLAAASARQQKSVSQLLKFNDYQRDTDSRIRWNKQIVKAFQTCIFNEDCDTIREFIGFFNTNTIILLDDITIDDLLPKSIKSGDPRLIQFLLHYSGITGFRTAPSDLPWNNNSDTEHRYLIMYQLVYARVQNIEPWACLLAPSLSEHLPVDLRSECSGSNRQLRHKNPESILTTNHTTQTGTHFDRDKFGHTKLHSAVMSNNCTQLTQYLNTGLGRELINIQRYDGCTALHLASLNGFHGCVCLLLENNADLSIVNADNKTALILASDPLVKNLFVYYSYQEARYRVNREGERVLAPNVTTRLKTFARDAFWKMVRKEIIEGTPQQTIASLLELQPDLFFSLGESS